MTRKIATADSATAEENSYMFPHGTRSAARPRVTREPVCSAAPTTASSIPAWPARLGRDAAATGMTGGTGGGGSRLGPPAITRVRAAAACRASGTPAVAAMTCFERRAACSPAKASIDRAYSSTVTKSRSSLRPARAALLTCGPLVTQG